MLDICRYVIHDQRLGDGSGLSVQCNPNWKFMLYNYKNMYEDY